MLIIAAIIISLGIVISTVLIINSLDNEKIYTSELAAMRNQLNYLNKLQDEAEIELAKLKEKPRKRITSSLPKEAPKPPMP